MSGSRTSSAGRAIGLAALLFLPGSVPRPSAAQILGPEFLVSSNSCCYVEPPKVTSNTSGKFLVVWQAGFSPAIAMGQRFETSGAKAGPEFALSPAATTHTNTPAVAMDDSSNFIVVWRTFTSIDPDGGIVGRRFSWSGDPIGSEFQVNTYTTNFQYRPAVSAAEDGRFVVVWSSRYPDGASGGVFGQRFDATGVPQGDEFQVHTTTTNTKDHASVVLSETGSFVVVWASGYLGYESQIFAQRFDSEGARVGGEQRISGPDSIYSNQPALAADDTDNFVVVWRQSGELEYGIMGARFDGTGSPIGEEFWVDSVGTQPRSPSVAMSGNGAFVVSWTAQDLGGNSYGDIAAQVFTPDGSRTGTAFRVNTNTSGFFMNSTVSNVASSGPGLGKLAVVWNANEQSSFHAAFGKKITVKIFSGGFELGHPCGWSLAVGAGCP